MVATFPFFQAVIERQQTKISAKKEGVKQSKPASESWRKSFSSNLAEEKKAWKPLCQPCQARENMKCLESNKTQICYRFFLGLGRTRPNYTQHCSGRKELAKLLLNILRLRLPLRLVKDFLWFCRRSPRLGQVLSGVRL